MRLWLILGMMAVGSFAMAAEDFNHLTCEYAKTVEGWEYQAANYSRDAFTLAPGESHQLTAAWTDGRAENLAYCTMMTGTAEESVVEIVFSVFKADRFHAIDGASCDVMGANVQLIKKEVHTLHRGEVANFVIENWFSGGNGELLLRQYLPLKEESDNVAPYAEPKCLSLIPQ